MSIHGTTQFAEELDETNTEPSDFRLSLDESSYELASLTNAQSDAAKDAPTSFTNDPFKPFDQDGANEQNILTLRAILVGSMFGALVNASNIYLGLKAGWTTSANIFGSIGGFAVLRSWSQRFPESSVLGGSFGPQENNIVQTAATAAGGMSSVFVSAIPAMYQLNLLTTPSKDFFRIVTLTAIGGYFGLLFAAPLRRFFIIKVAKDLNLVFPSSSATAITIRSMHLAADGSDSAWKTMRALALAFTFAGCVRILSQLTIVLDWHIFTWMVASGVFSHSAIAIESWGWFIEWTPAFIGSGMLVGVNVATSFTAGSVLAWGVIGPVLVSRGMAFGSSASSEPQWQGLMSYSSLAKDFASATHPSPRYWLLWPGVACMIAVAFAELAMQWRIFWVLGFDLFATVQRFLPNSLLSKHRYQVVAHGEHVSSISHDKDEISYRMWLPGLLVVIVLACLVTRLQYGMSIPETLLALLLAFVLSLIAIQATGATDTTPLTAVSKVTQVVLGATTRSSSVNHQAAQRLNLLGGALTSIGANQACDLIGDFRVGYLLTTPPTLQFWTQLIGTTFASLIAPIVFVMFASAYPCILSAESDDKCPFSAPSVSAWRAVAVAATEDKLPIPQSSINFSIFMAALGVASVLVKQYLWTGRWDWMRHYHPSIMIVALAFTLPATQYGIAMLMGALIARRWKKRNPVSFETYSYAIAAGFMAGEGVGGALNAVMAVVGVGGDKWGTSLGCPAGKC